MAATFCATIAQAQSPGSPAGPIFTLSRAIEEARANAPSLSAAKAGIDAASAARTVAGLRPNPTLNADYENIGGSRRYEAIEAPTQTLTLGLPLELGGKRSARIAVANAEMRSANAARALAEAHLRQLVTRLYVAAIVAEQRHAIAQDRLRIAEEGYQAATVRVRSGRASPLEQQRADLVRINARNAAEQAARLASLARNDLARRMGSASFGPLDQSWFGNVEESGRIRADHAASLVVANARSAEEIAAARVRLARSQRIPNVTVNAGARRLPGNNRVAAVAGISVPLPLFDTGRAAVAQASADHARASAERAATAMELEQAIAHAEAEVANQTAAARNATGPALAAAQEAARIARIGYREGKFGQLDLLDAERGLAEARNAATDALAAYHDARAELDRLTTSLEKE
jgi:cobalt-zinc-cadmium efflux system outer membrane protein